MQEIKKLIEEHVIDYQQLDIITCTVTVPNLRKVLQLKNKKILGLCYGMQLLCRNYNLKVQPLKIRHKETTKKKIKGMPVVRSFHFCMIVYKFFIAGVEFLLCQYKFFSSSMLPISGNM